MNDSMPESTQQTPDEAVTTGEAIAEDVKAEIAEDSTEAETSTETETSAETTSEDTPEGMSIENIKPKMALEGSVKQIELQGAIIDLDGLEQNGLLHISQLSSDVIKNVTDVVNQGDRVTAYVLAVDKDSGRIDLSLIKPPAFTWNEVKVNQEVDGTVERIEKYGVFVDIGAERPGLIHISELTAGYVADPTEIVNIGDSVTAKIIGVNKRKKQIDLSMRAMEEDDIVEDYEEEETEEFATAMELALRKALEQAEDGESVPKDKSAKKRDKKKGKFQQQDDIIKRTLRLHQDSN